MSDLLTEYADRNGCSVSRAAGKIIESYLICEEQESAHRQESKQQFLRLMNVLNQVLMCVYDQNKVSVESESAQECLQMIKKSVLELTSS